MSKGEEKCDRSMKTKSKRVRRERKGRGEIETYVREKREKLRGMREKSREGEKKERGKSKRQNERVRKRGKDERERNKR